jgi:hypothetical protein
MPSTFACGVFVQAPRRAAYVFLAATADNRKANSGRRSRYHGPFAAEVDFRVTLTFASNRPAVNMCSP